jgi:hypothetical protein
MARQYQISTDPDRLDVGLIHAFLHDARTGHGAFRAPVVERTIAHSLNFGLFHDRDGQVGFARVVTDYGVIAYLADVFVLPTSGPGSRPLAISTVVTHPDLQHLRRFTLATRAPHSLYESFGLRRTLDRRTSSRSAIAHRAVRH